MYYCYSKKHGDYRSYFHITIMGMGASSISNPNCNKSNKFNGDDPYGCRYNIYFLFLYNIVYCSVYPWYFQTLNIVWQSLIVYRWDTKRTFTDTPMHILRAYRSNHDTYNNQQVIYHNASMVNLLVILLSWLIIT